MIRSQSFVLRVLRWLWVLAAAVVITLGLLIALGRQLIPLLAAYPEKIAEKISTAIAMPVHIGALQGDWPGLTPRVRVQDLRLGPDQQALHLGDIHVRLDLLGSLLAGHWKLADVQVRGIKLIVQEDAKGHWVVQGLPTSSDQPFNPQVIFDLLGRFTRVGVHASEVDIRPLAEKAVRISDTELSLNWQLGGPRLDGRLWLPDHQPVAFSLRGQLDTGDWQRSGGQLYLSLPQTDWAGWIPSSLLADWHLKRLQAGGELWLDWANRQVQRGVLRLTSPLAEASYRDRKPLNLENLDITAFLQQNAEGYQLQLDPVAANFGKARWDAARLVVQQRLEPGAAPSWALAASQVDVGLLLQGVLALAPLPEKAENLLAGLQPHGLLNNLAMEYRPSAALSERLQLSADLQNVGFAPDNDIPGAEHVSGHLQGGIGGGELKLVSEDAQLHLAKLFPLPWHFASATGRLRWRLDDQFFSLIAQGLRTQGPLGEVNGDFLLRQSRDAKTDSYMDLRMGLRNGDLKHIGELLPTRVHGFSPALAEWLQSAIRGGSVETAYFLYQGLLGDKGPPEGRQMDLYVQTRDAELDYRPGWPVLRKLQGEVLLEDERVRVRAPTAQVLDGQARNIQAEVGKDARGILRVRVNTEVQSSLADGLRILREAPLEDLKTFAGWRGEGPLQGRLNLDIPLHENLRPKILVDLATQNASLTIDRPQMQFEALSGAFHFDSERGLSAPEVRALFLGRKVLANIRSEGSGGKIRSRVQANGSLPWTSLAGWLKLGSGIPLSGNLPYQLDMVFGGSGSQLQLNSNLQGVGVDLPAPFGKTPAEARPTKITIGLGGKAQQVDVDYGGLANLTLALPDGDWAQARGDLHLGGGTAQMPQETGLKVSGRLDNLDLSAWQAVYQRLSGGGKAAGQGSSGGALSVLRGGNLQVHSVNAFGQQVNDLQLGLTRERRRWRLALDSDQVAGSVWLPDDAAAPIDVALQRVRLPKGKTSIDSTSKAGDPLADFDPRQLPALNVSVEQVYLGPDLLGRWALKVRPQDAGSRIQDIDLQLKKGLRLTGLLVWSGTSGSMRTLFNGHLEGHDLSNVLLAWGYAPNASAEDFNLDVNGDWPGSLAALNLKTFSGTVNVHIRHGAFVEVQGPAAALRVFGLLNFGSIGRRLRLDFSDLLGRGLAFDEVTGNLRVVNGVYNTRAPITMQGPSSTLVLGGQLDMVQDSVDANLQVTLPLSNNLPLAALLAGAPAIGGALFIIDRVLGDRMDRIASVRYDIKGPISAPKINLARH